MSLPEVAEVNEYCSFILLAPNVKSDGRGDGLKLHYFAYFECIFPLVNYWSESYSPMEFSVHSYGMKFSKMEDRKECYYQETVIRLEG